MEPRFYDSGIGIVRADDDKGSVCDTLASELLGFAVLNRLAPVVEHANFFPTAVFDSFWRPFFFYEPGSSRL